MYPQQLRNVQVIFIVLWVYSRFLSQASNDQSMIHVWVFQLRRTVLFFDGYTTRFLLPRDDKDKGARSKIARTRNLAEDVSGRNVLNSFVSLELLQKSTKDDAKKNIPKCRFLIRCL